VVKKKILAYVIDDDQSVRRAFQMLFRSADIDVRTFSSAEEFLETANLVDGSCIVLDVCMPGLSGLDLQKELALRSNVPPIIVVSARDDTPTQDLARELGATAFFRKPVDDQALLDAISWAIRGREKNA
jgi:FixJ family two-component response regulator